MSLRNYYNGKVRVEEIEERPLTLESLVKKGSGVIFFDPRDEYRSRKYKVYYEGYELPGEYYLKENREVLDKELNPVKYEGENKILALSQEDNSQDTREPSGS